jgi:hypothetical protein
VSVESSFFETSRFHSSRSTSGPIRPGQGHSAVGQASS